MCGLEIPRVQCVSLILCLYSGCPGSLEVGKLKLLCQRLFKVPAARQALFLKAGGDNPMPDNIGQDNSKVLMFFSVEVSSLSFLVTRIPSAKPIV